VVKRYLSIPRDKPADRNFRSDPHYTQVMVFDFDDDGRA